MPDSHDLLWKELTNRLAGEVHFDRLMRTLYATDASIYEIVPAGVVVPRDLNDVVQTVRSCAEHGVPIVPRGGGTGLAGGAVGAGVQLDVSKYIRHIAEPDPVKRTIRVGAGAVLDHVNRAAARLGLQFAPDVATSSRATIGGMIANNSSGAHSIIYGRTVDHLREITCVLSDGSTVIWNRHDGARSADGGAPGPLACSIRDQLAAITSQHREEIIRRYPRILRKSGGYGLDRLVEMSPEVEPSVIVCGSEGTLCAVVEAELELIPLPTHKRLLVAEFGSLTDAMGAVPRILQHMPAAVELIDRLIIRAARRESAESVARFISGDPPAVLIIELYDESPEQIDRRLDDLHAEMQLDPSTTGCTPIREPALQAAVWAARKRGLGLLLSRPGDRQPYGFVEDTAVDPSRLQEYVARFDDVLARLGVEEVSHYAHASVGCLHIRPVLNLKNSGGVATMQAISEAVSDLVLEFGGAMTAEHGDGLVRSCWHEKMYGPQIVSAFAAVKQAFDPHNLFNPGKIVTPPPMHENLRYGGGYDAAQPGTHLDFSAYNGPAGLAQMCSGLGQCRQSNTGVMCPSYMATHDERHTTRARANAVRVALSNRGLLEGWHDPALDDVMELCLACKACRTECPANVDLARIKAEWLAARNRRQGVPRSARFVADAPRRAALGSRFAPFNNWVLQSGWVRAFLERRYGLDRRIAPPRFSRQTFRQWFKGHRRQRTGPPGPRGRVVYWADCWTNHFNPQVGQAAVKLLEAAGYDVLSPKLECCGRPMISKGMLPDATHLAELNVKRLAPLALAGVPIVGTEPSCILSLVDEYPQLVRNIDAQQLARQAAPIQVLLAGLILQHPDLLHFDSEPQQAIYHGHCHEKALIGMDAALTTLRAALGEGVVPLDTGCCGMAGSFGHERDHYEVARAIGEERLFPAVRNRGDALLAVAGFSCREQIRHHTGVEPRHFVEILAERLLASSNHGASEPIGT